MKLENNIGWCDCTKNKVIGCDKVSLGCKNCYAEHDTPARVLRAGKWPGYPQPTETWGPKGVRVPVAGFSKQVRAWNKLCICDTCHETAPINRMANMEKCLDCGGDGFRRIRVFANSNSDWLDEKWPIEIFADFLKDIHDCPNLDFQLLTKRTENFEPRMRDAWRVLYAAGHLDAALMVDRWIGMNGDKLPPAHVWLGASVENQKAADERIPQILRIPAAVRFLSVEPMLEAIDLKLNRNGHQLQRTIGQDIHWAIFGGESGDDARECNIQWILDGVKQCQSADVRAYVKQLGKVAVCDNANMFDWPKEAILTARGTSFAGATLVSSDGHGGDMSQWPDELKVREFPR